MAPPQMRFLNLNPFTHLAITYQEILYFQGPSADSLPNAGVVGHGGWLLVLGAISIAFFLFGYFVFDRLRDTFAEEV
jgi:ABC-type polysaccharide/polyol phosphate export permease